MDTVTEYSQPPRPRRWTGRRLVAVAIFVVLVAALSAAYIAWRPAYKPLFQGLAPRDAALIAAELKREQIPFRIEPGTGAVLVPERDERAARLQLIGGSMHLNEVVGLELFNDSDLGLTDFAQKVNYQRALQGELARTIMSLDEVVLARVHVALPESALFRGAQAAPKASVAVFARDGVALRPQVVGGIQRLVAAAIPGMQPGAVTVLDHRGGALSDRDESAITPGQFQTATEGELLRKLEPQLRSLLGAGLAELLVRVELNVDFPDPESEAPPDSDPAFGSHDSAEGAGPAPVPVVRHSIERIVVTVLLERALPPDLRAQVRGLVSATAGLDASRGDLVHMSVRPPPAPVAAAPAVEPVRLYRRVLVAALAACAVATVWAAWYARRRARTQAPTRDQILRDLQRRLLKVGSA
jgi:flagellar M-ring protein FliF